ncbi:restriction endonuclease subunit S [Nicoliella spurrieriana]|uniref:Restriction endonuclease subunit S n=1 Tax=Nicoliella spurrieriana TaxID=2925830 RepID=A0A976X5N3_9LACO|nr:restriction endonuclease subunit S [Nicoliella spurrieriana]UQS86896.1 restriction endonuclease subunit S [Nicoliella spurrieriana]
MTVRAPVGEVAINQFTEIVLGRGVCSISGNLFIYFLLLSLKNRNFWKRYSSGSTFLSINSNDIKNLLVYIPNDKEQKKIGLFLQKLDQLIELQSQKVTHLKQLKRGFLQKLYPAKGVSVNLLRFHTFNDDLLNVSLKDISYNQSSNIGVKDVKKNGKYPVYDVNKLIGFLNSYQSKDEYISIIKDGSNVGKTFLRRGMTSVISTMEIIHPNGVDLNYLFYKLQNINFRLFKIGTGIPHIYFKDYSKLKLLIPHPKEQKKIGAFFQNLDQQIDLQQSKLDHLKQLKKGYLQNMFI